MYLGDDMPYVQYIVIAIVLVVITLVIMKANKKDFYIEANKLIEYLGGKNNILDTEVNMSRFKVTLRDVSIVNKEAIQKLGARGIVEIDNQLKIIFGEESNRLKKYIDDLSKK